MLSDTAPMKVGQGLVLKDRSLFGLKEGEGRSDPERGLALSTSISPCPKKRDARLRSNILTLL